MNQQILDSVLLALNPEPAPAERIAERANLGRNQTYQALVHLYDRGLAFMSQEPVTRRIEGWTA
jgi:DNA-binding IclR family transcriptional regulator